jgi:hypothetical protein
MSLSVGLRFGWSVSEECAIGYQQPNPQMSNVTGSMMPRSGVVVCISRDTVGRSGACGSAASSHCLASWKSRRPRASVGKRYCLTHRMASSRTANLSRCSGASFLGGLKGCAGSGTGQSELPSDPDPRPYPCPACTRRHGNAVSSEYYARGTTRVSIAVITGRRCPRAPCRRGINVRRCMSCSHCAVARQVSIALL